MRKVGKDFIIIFRLSMLDLVEKGSDWAEVPPASIPLSFVSPKWSSLAPKLMDVYERCRVATCQKSFP